MENNKNRSGLHDRQSQNQGNQKQDIGNQQRTSQTGGQNNRGRNLNQNQDLNVSQEKDQNKSRSSSGL
jgi:hypothetical protein